MYVIGVVNSSKILISTDNIKTSLADTVIHNKKHKLFDQKVRKPSKNKYITYKLMLQHDLILV